MIGIPKVRWKYLNKRQNTASTVFDDTLSTQGYVEYAHIVKTALCCDKCGWHWDYHEQGSCPSRARQQELVAQELRNAD